MKPSPRWHRHRPILASLLCMMLGLPSCIAAQTRYPLRPPAPGALAAGTAAVTDPTLLVVLIDPDAEIDGLVAAAAGLGYGLRARDLLASLDLVMLSFDIPQGTTGPEAIAEIEALDSAATAGVNHRYVLQQVLNRPPGARVYANAMIGWPDAGCPATRTVGILDGPVDAIAIAARGADLRVRDFRSDQRPADTAHATAVAELVAGPDRLRSAPLRVAVVADRTGGAGVANLVRGLAWTLESGAGVVNVSLAGPYNKILDRGFTQATARGATIVAAVGNDGPEAPPRYPAAFDDVIAVTAVDTARRPLRNAGRGPQVDVAAPGVEVWVDAGGGRYVTGTSFAAPFVTAALAAGGTLRMIDLGPPGRDDTFGAGLLAVDGCTRR